MGTVELDGALSPFLTAFFVAKTGSVVTFSANLRFSQGGKSIGVADGRPQLALIAWRSANASGLHAQCTRKDTLSLQKLGKAAGLRRLRPFEDQGKPALQER